MKSGCNIVIKNNFPNKVFTCSTRIQTFKDPRQIKSDKNKKPNNNITIRRDGHSVPAYY